MTVVTNKIQRCLLRHLFRYLLVLLLFSVVQSSRAQSYTRGIGVYPGDPKENFAPVLKIDAAHYRNLALHRAAYQSSAYDYNLAASSITDGITDAEMPGWIVTSSGGILPRDGREHMLDRHASSQQQITGSNVWLQVQMAGNYFVPPVDSISLTGSVIIDTLITKPWAITISGSDDGQKWDELGKASGDALPGTDALTELMKRFSLPQGQKFSPQQMGFLRRFAPSDRRVLNYTFKLPHKVSYKYYRFNGDDPGAKTWSVSDLVFVYQNKTAPIGGPYRFNSAWKSAGSGTEWVYVDLGAICDFNQVGLDWISPAAEGAVQVSDNAREWQDIAQLTPNPPTDTTTVINLAKPAKGRYVRILMTKPVNAELGYMLGEIEVMGTGGPVPVAQPQPEVQPNGKLNLAGGAWKLQRASLVNAEGNFISSMNATDEEWLPATVPGTTLVSYLNAGALPDPNYGDNNLAISDSYFYDDFWYRNVFIVPASYAGKRIFLNFDGINWKAEVYLNSNLVGRINGAFTRGKFDVTNMVMPGNKNVLAVRIIKNETPGFPTEQNRNSTDANGGELGADNPTFHASVGWDWIPTIRGRNTGIWNSVYLESGGQVAIENPLITSTLPLPDTTTADLHLEVTVRNYNKQTVQGTLRGKIGSVSFEQAVTLAASEIKTIRLNPITHPVLRLHHPKLWWPNGYGQQNLYNVSLSFVTADGIPSDEKKFKTGIREMTYSDAGGSLKLWVNGKRFIARGGNWGFAEDMLRYRAREYDVAVGYHQEMNFNMIRNWVGQIGDDAFFEACDKYGIMIWQDFWLANPSDGPDPANPGMFIDNMKDFVKRIRNHPSIALYVGRNEGNPPLVLEEAIAAALPVLAPGIKYIPNSAFGTVSGGGPYGLMPLKYYFQNRATPKLHSEMGMPDLMSYESFKLTMPDSALSPQSRLWGVHDFTLQGAQNGSSFNQTVEKVFGKTDDVKKWLNLAAWTEYQGYRAMFEAQSKHRMGLLIWMSHPAWPSLAWQSYDYYFEPTGAYFGGKKASEPLHIQWNPLTDSVEVVNYSIPHAEGLMAKLQVIDLDGTVRSSTQAQVNCAPDSTASVMPVSIPANLSSVYFIRLQLLKGDSILSRNDYCRGADADSAGGIGNLQAILKLPAIQLNTQTQSVKTGDHWNITTQLANKTATPAFNVRLKVIGTTSGNRILPVIYNDNYFTLLPGETRTIVIKVADADTQGEKLDVAVEGLNIQ